LGLRPEGFAATDFSASAAARMISSGRRNAETLPRRASLKAIQRFQRADSADVLGNER
jgi:hypothetical protein